MRYRPGLFARAGAGVVLRRGVRFGPDTMVRKTRGQRDEEARARRDERRRRRERDEERQRQEREERERQRRERAEREERERREREREDREDSDTEDEREERRRSPRRRRRFEFQSFQVKDGKETWNEYKRRLGQALETQRFTTGADKKRALLTCSDPELYRLMIALCYPDVLESAGVTYDHLIELMDEQFEEVVSEAMVEFQFEMRVQRAGESVADWLADLRQLAIPCKFLTQDLNRRLRGQLVRGVHDKSCQTKLLEASDLDVKKAVLIIRTHARSKAESKALSSRPAEPASTSYVVGYVSNTNRDRTGWPECYRCGSSRHASDACWAREAECHGCGEVGHLQRKC